MKGFNVLTLLAILPLATGSIAFESFESDEPVSLYQNLYRFRTLGLETYAPFSEDLSTQLVKAKSESQEAFKLYALFLSEDFDRVSNEKVREYFEKMDIRRVDLYFGYLANNMFVDANTEIANIFFGKSMTREHQSKLDRILPVIQKNYKLTGKLPASSLVKFVQRIIPSSSYAKCIDNGETKHLRKIIALLSKTEELLAFIVEESLYFIQMIRKTEFFTLRAGSEETLETLMKMSPLKLEEIACSGF